jgi:hypothetical protein
MATRAEPVTNPAPPRTRRRRATQPTTAESAPAAVAAPAEAGSISVRMYRQGLGDCLLVTLPRPGGKPFRMLIDCGVILGTANAQALMREVVQDIVGETGGFVDVLVVTHEHYDHVCGFTLAADQFADPKQQEGPGKLRVGETWFAWTEDPSDALGRRLREARDERVSRLAALADSLRSQGIASNLAAGVEELLGFFGAGAAAPAGGTSQAMANARSFASRVAYRRPGEAPITFADVPDIRVWVLGPPRDEKLLRRTFISDEVYHLAPNDSEDEAFFLAQGLGEAGRLGPGEGGGDPYAPFDAAYGGPLVNHAAAGAAQASSPMRLPMASFLSQHYYGPSDDALNPDQSWRRIDEDWLGQAADFALQLDSATNNTSLVLAIEVISTGQVLLFAADAQVGNWESWQSLSWTLPGGSRVTGPDLLKRTVFYKVGHHGSHNATLREQGLEMMPQGLVAFIPVDHDMAVRKRWGQMPLPGLVEALEQRSGGQVVRIDAPFPDPLGGAAAAAKFRKRATPGGKADNEPLYYEWQVPARVVR